MPVSNLTCLTLGVRSLERSAAFYRALGFKAGPPMDGVAFWGGYSGYFRDPDGHLWELAWNPFRQLDREGRVSLKKPRRRA